MVSRAFVVFGAGEGGGGNGSFKGSYEGSIEEFDSMTLSLSPYMV